jgi:hypothetical protein
MDRSKEMDVSKLARRVRARAISKLFGQGAPPTWLERTNELLGTLNMEYRTCFIDGRTLTLFDVVEVEGKEALVSLIGKLSLIVIVRQKTGV